jgi:hypothetical protein
MRTCAFWTNLHGSAATMKEAVIVASALHLDRPFFGSRRTAVTLGVGRTRIRRPMRILGIEAHYPKRNLSRPVPGYEIHPGDPRSQLQPPSQP